MVYTKVFQRFKGSGLKHVDYTVVSTHDRLWVTHTILFDDLLGGGPRAVVSTAAFRARVRGSVPGLGGLKETKNVSSLSTCESQYCGEPL